MKKVIFFLLAIGLLTGATYLLIPAKLVIAERIVADCSIGCVQRMAGSPAYRNKWWPGEGRQLSATKYFLDDCTFTFPVDMLYNNTIKAEYKDIRISGIFITDITGSNSTVSLIFELNSSSNPFTRVSTYVKAKRIKSCLEKIMKNFLLFLNSKERVYGIDMDITSLSDSTLIAIKDTAAAYPGVTAIYENIGKLQRYALENGAAETNYPMLNIKKEASSVYSFMVALPVNKNLPAAGAIIAKRMLPGGNFIQTGEIRGSFSVVDSFIKEIENYRSDNNVISPAIPFQSLQTNRLKEKDSSKWITRLYYPVF